MITGRCLPWLRYIALFLGFIILTVAGVFWYKHTHPLSDPEFGFQYYQPTSLPTGFHVTDKVVNILNPDGKLYGMRAELNLRTEDWVYDISETRATGQLIATPLHNYNPTSVGVTCRQGHSPQGTLYRLCHWVDYGRISVYEVEFIQGGTYIETRLPGTLSSPVPESQIDAYVDGFIKASATGFRMNSGGI